MPKQVIVIRKDLNMRKGKMIAQGAHASMAVLLNAGEHLTIKGQDINVFAIPMNHLALKKWTSESFKKITVYVNSEEELCALYENARSAGLLCSLIVDSGLTEFNGIATKTAVAIGPAFADEINPITGHLPLL